MASSTNSDRLAHTSDSPADSPESCDNKRYFRGDLARFNAGGGSHLLYAAVNEAAGILPAQVAGWIEIIQQPGTLTDHARTIFAALTARQHSQQPAPSSQPVSNSRPGPLARLFGRGATPTPVKPAGTPAGPTSDALQPIIDELVRLAGTGLLIPEDSLFDAIIKHAQSETDPGPVSMAGVITKDRTSSLERCLTSLIDNCRKYFRCPRFVVADDSSSGAARDFNKQMLRALGSRLNVAIDYLGFEEKIAYKKALARATSFSPELLDFALGDTRPPGHSTGANRNWLLLASVGQLFVSLDDDVMCRISRRQSQTDGLIFQGAGHAQEFDFFPGRGEATDAVLPADNDFLGIHELLLGKAITACAASYTKEAVSIDPFFVRPLMRGEGRVLLTQNGAVGDSGMTAPLWLALGGPSRSRMTASEAAYNLASTSREMLRAAIGPAVTADPWCMAMVLGCDNRDLLPPFFPVLRNQDGLFGVTVRACFNEGYLGHLPWEVLHAPPDRRDSDPAARRRGTFVDTWNIVLVCISSLTQLRATDDGPSRMRAVGKHLIDIGTLRQSDFDEFIRIQLWSHQSAFINQLEALLNYHGRQPDYWAADVDRYIQESQQALSNTDYVVPRDLLAAGRSPSSEDGKRALEWARRLVDLFGQTLQCWPDIVTTAKELKLKGIVPPVSSATSK